MALPEELSKLPPPRMVEEISYEESLAALRVRLVQLFLDAGIEYNVEDLETDPAQILLQVANYPIVALRVRINEAIRSWFLAYATGGDLDALAFWYDVERMSMETDDALRLRIIENIRGRSPGGTEARYRAIALGASPEVDDVAVYTLGRNPTVHVAVFSKEPGGVASPALLEQVRAALNAPDVRMVNDTISVEGAARHAYNVVANMWLLPEAPESVLQVAEQFLASEWQRQMRLGRDLNRSWIISKLQVDGVQRVQLIEPVTDIEIPFDRAAGLGRVTLNLMGRAY